MVRIISATFAGALIIYIWLMASWMLLGLHNSTFRSLPDSAEVTTALKLRDLKTGLYHVPEFTEEYADLNEEELKAAQQKFHDEHVAGPVYTVFYHKEGGAPMSAKVLGSAVLLDIVCAALAAIILWCAAPRLPNYFCRVALVGMLGLFVALMGHVSYLIWMWFPLEYTLVMCLDMVVGWTLVGFAQAAIIKPPASNVAAA